MIAFKIQHGVQAAGDGLDRSLACRHPGGASPREILGEAQRLLGVRSDRFAARVLVLSLHADSLLGRRRQAGAPVIALQRTAEAVWGHVVEELARVRLQHRLIAEAAEDAMQDSGAPETALLLLDRAVRDAADVVADHLCRARRMVDDSVREHLPGGGFAPLQIRGRGSRPGGGGTSHPHSAPPPGRPRGAFAWIEERKARATA